MKKIITAMILISMMISGSLIFSAQNSELMLEQGMDALRSGNYSSAELIFRRLSASDEEDIKDRALFYMARSIFMQKNYKSAKHEFTSYLNKCRTISLCQEARYWLAESDFHLQNYSSAIEEYKRYIDRNKDEHLAQVSHDRIGAIYFEQKRYAEAVMEWEQAVKLSSDQKANAVRVLNIGRSLAKNNQYNEALNRVSPLFSSKADPMVIASARILSGRIYQHQNNHSKALVMFNCVPENLLKISPYWEARYFKALSLINKGDTAGAKYQLQIFLFIAREDKWFYHATYELGILNLKNGDTETGLAQLEEVLKSDNADLRISANRALGTWYMNRDLKKSAEYLEASLKEGTDESRDMRLSLAEVYIQQGKIQEADKILTEYQANYPYDRSMDRVNFLLGRTALLKKDNSQAKKYFDNIRQESPFSEYINEADLYTAEACCNEGNYEEAQKILLSYYYKKESKNKYEAAVLLVRNSIKTGSSGYAKTFTNQLINSYISRDGVEEVIYEYTDFCSRSGISCAYYRKVITDKFPDSESAYKLYLEDGDTAFAAGKYKTAVYYYDKFLAGNVKHGRGTAFYNRAMSLFNMKKYNEVISMFKNSEIPALEEDQWLEIPFLLARCCYAVGEKEKIYSSFLPSETSELPDDVFFMYIESSVETGNCLILDENMDRILSDPKKAPSILFLAGTCIEAKDREQADKYFTMLAEKFPASKEADQAAYKAALYRYEKSRTAEAQELLGSIKDTSLSMNKNMLTILCLFAEKQEKQAAELSDRYVSRFPKNENSKKILQLNLDLRYKNDDLNGFKNYSYYLTNRFPETADDVNFLSGQFYMKRKDYKTAYFWLQKESASDKEHAPARLFLCGKISLLYYKKTLQAEQYFSSLLSGFPDSEEAQNCRFDLAMIYLENSRKSEGEALLKQIIEKGTDKDRIKAENILTTYQTGIQE